MVWTGLAEGTADTTMVQDGTVSGTLCGLFLNYQSEQQTGCTITGHGLCGDNTGTISLTGLVPPLPLGGPSSISGGVLTWSLSHESGADLGFGGLSAEVQTTITATLNAP